jgi:hypothetical protein
MASHRDVFVSEDGEYLTYPDGDPAEPEEIERYTEMLSPEFRKLLGEKTTVLIHGVGGKGNVYRRF